MKKILDWLKKNWLIAIYLVLLPFVLAMLWQVHWADVWAVLAKLTPDKLGVLLIINIAIVLLAGLRWWLFIDALGWKVPYPATVLYRLAGFGLSFFTPGPQFGGEPLQILMLQRRHQVPGTEALSSVMLERLLELLANFIVLIICAAVAIGSGFFGQHPVRWIILAITISLVLLPLGYLVAVARHYLLFPRLPKEWHRLRLVQWGIQSEIRLAETWHAHPRVFIKAGFVLTLTWVLQVTEFGLSLRYLGYPFTMSQILTFLLFARLTYLSPVPGGFGVLELSQAWVSQAMGGSTALGIGFGLLIHTRDVVFASIGYAIGLYYTQRQTKQST